MTLVLPYCSEQTDGRLFCDPLRAKMPCVYEGEPLDFESALVSGEWPALKDIAAEYEQSDDSARTASGPADRSPSKRKHSSSAEPPGDASEAKKPCPFPADAEVEDDPYPPRRRGPQMWNSRQRWKDERKKVLKMSVAKLAEVEDPELLLWRSVLINNTIKRLHHEIRTERQAKIRHRQHKSDFFPCEAPSAAAKTPEAAFDDSSCDEIFGISEDFLRVTIPDRRLAASPVPPSLRKDSADMEVDAYPARPPTNSAARPCAAQYRTNEAGDATFPPRVPILDSVVYHSLLASLESS